MKTPSFALGDPFVFVAFHFVWRCLLMRSVEIRLRRPPGKPIAALQRECDERSPVTQIGTWQRNEGDLRPSRAVFGVRPCKNNLPLASEAGMRNVAGCCQVLVLFIGRFPMWINVPMREVNLFVPPPEQIPH